MDNLDNIFASPSRRDVLRWGLTCGAACALAGTRFARAQQDNAGTPELAGLKLPGVARHEAMFWEKTSDGGIKCLLCPRGCEVTDDERGYCGVRENQGGRYQTLVYGTLCSANVDPIEKKPLFHYQPGSQAFSIATAIEPEILLVDEVLSAGDMAFQSKARERMRALMSNARAVIVVSHDLASLPLLCDKAIWLDHGNIQMIGPTEQVIAAYTQQVSSGADQRKAA